MAGKAISKILRYSALVLGLMVVALLVAPFFINVNDYKNRIEHEVENATGRHLTIGAVQASLFPWIGVSLDDVHLANRAGFSEHDFFSVQRLHVKLALLPLLNRRVEIKEFEISGPNIYLERHADGQSNWDDLLPSTTNTESASTSAEESETEKASKPILAALKAESLRLNGGTLTWNDQAAEKSLTISEIELALDDVQVDRPVAVSLSAKLSGNQVNMHAQVGPVGDLAGLDIQKLPIQGEIRADKVRLTDFSEYLKAWPQNLGPLADATAGLTVRFEQRPDGIRLSDGQVMLDAAHDMALNWKLELPTSAHMDLRNASVSVDGKDVIEAKGNVLDLASDPRFQLKISSSTIQRSWLAGMIPELNSLYAGHPAPWQQLSFGTLIAGDARHLDIRDLQLKLDSELVQVSGAIVYSRPDIRLRIASRTLHLDPWLPKASANAAVPVEPGVQSGDTESKAAVEPDLRFLTPWRLTAKVEVDALSVHGLNMQNFQMNMTGSDGSFDMNPMRFNLSGGQVVEKASLNAAVFPARWKESVHVSGVNLGPVLKSLLDMNMLEGTLAMDTSFSATGLTEAATKSLNGRGKVLLSDGKIRGFNIAGAIRKFTQPGAQSEPQETDFAQLSGSFTVRNGIASNSDLFMASPLLRVSGEGTVDLVNKQLDYHVKPIVVGTLTGQGDTVSLRKGLTVPLHISGPFAAPKIKPEINAKTLIENAPALLDKKGNLGGKLGTILGQPPAQQPSDTQSPASAPAAPASPDKKVRDAIGGLLKGF
ncbi:MAG TPA: AsmA family protein [Mariprofundaceae bacterium]|nr:AsmA family protein [Mariprofundaceae bacterium]